MTTPGAQLAAFAANLRFADIPASVVCKTEDLLVDWFRSAIGGTRLRQGGFRALAVAAWHRRLGGRVRSGRRAAR